ncbi:MAG: sulfite exporter TauE/SafE family protein [Methanobacterium sp.]
MDTNIFYFIILLITGAGIGFASGLLGVGGGFIMVPVLYWLMTLTGIDSTIAIRVSVGTSLAVILPTALSGAYGHYRKNAVLVKPTIYLAAGGIIGGILGGLIATSIPGDILKIIFGIAVIVVALIMLVVKYPDINEKPRDNIAYFLIGGFMVGIFSGLLGVGGGFIMVPFMIILLRFDIIKAIGTSTAVIVFTSIGGIMAYVFNGMGVSGLPSYSLGYVNLLQFILLVILSVPMAQIGVKAAHSISRKKMNYIFIIMLILIGLRMIGII